MPIKGAIKHRLSIMRVQDNGANYPGCANWRGSNYPAHTLHGSGVLIVQVNDCFSSNWII